MHAPRAESLYQTLSYNSSSFTKPAVKQGWPRRAIQTKSKSTGIASGALGQPRTLQVRRNIGAGIPHLVGFHELLLAFVNTLEVSILGSFFFEHFLGYFPQLEQNVAGDLVSLNAFVLELGQNLAVLVLALGQTTGGCRGAGSLNQRLLCLGGTCPLVLVDQHVLGSELLVPA